MSENRLLLIDGHSILSRAFYGIPELTNSEGKHTNAVYGFLNILLKELELEEADHLAVAFDLPAPTFRHKLFPEYKGTRKAMPEELREQVPLMQELLSSMHIPILKKEGYEADDILGTIAKRMQKEGKEVVIVSGDRDLLQLADTRIKISLPKTSRGQTEILSYFPEDVRAEWKVSPEEFIDLKALMGDSSDNIPGVPGMGPKTAEWIIQHYHTIENAKEHALEEDFKVPRKPRAGQELLEHWDFARLSKTLATIFLEVPIDFDFRDARVENLFNEESLAMVRRLEFKSLVKRFDEGLLLKGEGEGTLSLPECRDVTDPYLFGIVFSDAENAASAGFFLAREEDEEVLYFALSKDRLYRFHGFPFGEKLNALSERTLLYTLSLKEQLSRTEISENGNWQDLSLAAYLLNPLKDSYDYDDLSRDYLGLLLPSEKELGDSERPGKYRAFLSLLSGKKLLSRLDKKERELYREIEVPLVFTLHEMEESGILVDREALLSYGAELREKIGEIRERIYREAGEEFNLNSPQQLGQILFEKLGLPGGRKTKTGYSTAADVLEKLSEENHLASDILEYRTYSKLNSTYAEGLLSWIREDGRIHGHFNQMVTATGRISSTDPNLQNIPIRTEMGRRFRRVFIPKEGSIFIDADYSQVELRILAALSGDEKLIRAYQNADDIHAVTASEVFHVPLSEVTPQLRRNAKAVNFGIVYGISAFGLSEGLSISRQEAKEYIERYFETYPGVKKFLDGEVELARKQGYVRTIFGRKRPVPDISSSNFARRSFGERVAMNSPIQGSAADIMKKAMNEVSRTLKEEGFRARIVLQVHDELLLETPEGEADQVEKLLILSMQNAAKLRVPLIADAKRGRNWEEAH